MIDLLTKRSPMEAVISTIFAVAIFVVAFFAVLMIFLAQITDFHVDIVKPSFQQVSAIDKAHLVEKCLEGSSGFADSSAMSDAVGYCAKQANVGYVEVKDLDNNLVWSAGESTSPEYASHRIFISIKDSSGVHVGRLYVKGDSA